MLKASEIRARVAKCKKYLKNRPRGYHHVPRGESAVTVFEDGVQKIQAYSIVDRIPWSAPDDPRQPCTVLFERNEVVKARPHTPLSTMVALVRQPTQHGFVWRLSATQGDKRPEDSYFYISVDQAERCKEYLNRNPDKPVYTGNLPTVLWNYLWGECFGGDE